MAGDHHAAGAGAPPDRRIRTLVIKARGLRYRRECLERWERETIPAEQAAKDWERLAEACQQAVRR
ncbi:MAG: hypothetical protein J2P21_01810 [Chloracidobacterium sp.]|nr:hypothetical protein [Chloracidobacterium sp.]